MRKRTSHMTSGNSLSVRYVCTVCAFYVYSTIIMVIAINRGSPPNISGNELRDSFSSYENVKKSRYNRICGVVTCIIIHVGFLSSIKWPCIYDRTDVWPTLSRKVKGKRNVSLLINILMVINHAKDRVIVIVVKEGV